MAKVGRSNIEGLLLSEEVLITFQSVEFETFKVSTNFKSLNLSL